MAGDSGHRVRARGLTPTAGVALGGILAGIALRLLLLPTTGLRDDTDQFAGWIRHIAVNGLTDAYAEELTFGPIVAYAWGLLAAVEPGFRMAVDASDPWLRMLIKLPPTLADLGLAATIAFALRHRPVLAAGAAVATLLHPAIWYVSAWWGQYESVYVLAALVATVLAISGRNGLAAAALTIAVLTKPQALPFILPFAAWFLAKGGPGGLLRAALAGLVTAGVVWAPFLPDGPLDYLRGIGALQDETFSILSLRAWNVWWIVQDVVAGGDFVSDSVAFLGPITLRHVAYAVTGALSLLVAYRVWRDPRPVTLVLGLAAATLIAFTFLTTMHERYAYASVALLMLVVGDGRLRLLALGAGALITLNLVAAVPAGPPLNGVPLSGPIGVAGSLGLIGVTAYLIRLLVAGPAATSAIDLGAPRDLPTRA